MLFLFILIYFMCLVGKTCRVVSNLFPLVRCEFIKPSSLEPEAQSKLAHTAEVLAGDVSGWKHMLGGSSHFVSS